MFNDPIWGKLGLWVLVALAPFLLLSFVWYIVQPAWRKVVRSVIRKRVAEMRVLMDYFKLRLGDRDFEGTLKTWGDTEYKYVTDAELRHELARLSKLRDFWSSSVSRSAKRHWWWVTASPFNHRQDPLNRYLPFGHWLKKYERFVIGESYHRLRTRAVMPVTLGDTLGTLLYMLLHYPLYWKERIQDKLHNWMVYFYWLYDPITVVLYRKVSKKAEWVRTALEFRKQTLGKHPSKQKDFGYYGDVPYDDTWRVLKKSGRSRGSEDETNFNYLMMYEYFREKFGDEDEDNGWFVERYNHWAVGWVEGIFIQVFHSRKHLWPTKIALDVDDTGMDNEGLYFLHVDDLWYEVERMTILHHIEYLDFVDKSRIPDALKDSYSTYAIAHSSSESLMAGEPDLKYEPNDESAKNVLSEMGQYSVPAWTYLVELAGVDTSVYFDEGSYCVMDVILVLASMGWLDLEKVVEEKKRQNAKSYPGWDSIDDDWAAQVSKVMWSKPWWEVGDVEKPDGYFEELLDEGAIDDITAEWLEAHKHDEAHKYMKRMEGF